MTSELIGPLAFLVGTWRGEGVGGYPTLAADFRFGQEIVFTAYGKPVLAYRTRTWALDDERPLFREAGFWRVLPEAAVEVTLALPSGVVEIFVGHVTGERVELATDVVARTATAKEVTAEKRLYGLVEDELMYAADMAAMGQPLVPHVSARLRRVESGLS